MQPTDTNCELCIRASAALSAAQSRIHYLECEMSRALLVLERQVGAIHGVIRSLITDVTGIPPC